MSSHKALKKAGFCAERRDDGAPCTLGWGHGGKHSYCGCEFEVLWRTRDTLLVILALLCAMVLATVFSGVVDTVIERYW